MPSEEVSWEQAKKDAENEEMLSGPVSGAPESNAPQAPAPPAPPVQAAPGSHPQDDSDQARDVQEQQAEAGSSEPQEKAEEDQIDIIKPKKDPKQWDFRDNRGNDAKYIQTGLGYFAKMQWFSLVGEVIDKALSGDDKLNVSTLFDGGFAGVSDLRELDTFLQAAAKLLVYAPDFLEKSYCIWLNVPEHERVWARLAMSQDPVDGGLSDEQGIEIIEIFIDQNWEAIETFFRDRLPQLLDRARSRRREAEESRQSRP